MAKCGSFLCTILMLQVSQAYGGHLKDYLAATRQYSGNYIGNNYEFVPDKWNALHFHPMGSPPSHLPVHHLDYVSQFERPTPVMNPYRKYLYNSYSEEQRNQAVLLGLLNNEYSSANTLRQFPNLPINIFQPVSCTSPSGESGICTLGFLCSLSGGSPSGSCAFGGVCCISIVSTCGEMATLNNTNWQSPSTGVSASSTCTLNVVTEQSRQPICQIRLDFVTFTTAQPEAGTCADTFTVVGTTTVAPTICGDNSGQHMYLDVPSSGTSPSDVQLKFKFSSGIATRSWNIQIAMLPCGATYLAPADCLQYFTDTAGRVKSFNWKDVDGTEIRQLNNQNYNICFRTELISSKKATQMCLSVCEVTNGGDAFSITTPTSADAAAAAAALAAAMTDFDNAQAALNDAQATLAAAETALADSQTALAAAQDTLTTATNALTAAQDALATAQDAVPVAQSALDAAQGALTDAQTALDTAKGTLTTAQATLVTAQDDLAAAVAAVADPLNPTAAETATIDAAQAVVDGAQTAVTDAQAAADSAQSAFDTAQTGVTNAQTALDNAQTAVNDAQTAADSAQTDVNNAQTAVTDAQTAVDNAQMDVDNAQGPVTDAEAAVAAAQDALTSAQAAVDNVGNSAETLSGVGISASINGVNTATCLYDFLLIAGARDSTTNAEADRICGNALNPAITPVETSVQVCTTMKPFKMTYRTDGTEDAVAEAENVLPAPADSGNVGFCLDYQEKL